MHCPAGSYIFADQGPGTLGPGTGELAAARLQPRDQASNHPGVRQRGTDAVQERGVLHLDACITVAADGPARRGDGVFWRGSADTRCGAPPAVPAPVPPALPG